MLLFFILLNQNIFSFASLKKFFFYLWVSTHFLNYSAVHHCELFKPKMINSIVVCYSFISYLLESSYLRSKMYFLFLSIFDFFKSALRVYQQFKLSVLFLFLFRLFSPKMFCFGWIWPIKWLHTFIPFRCSFTFLWLFRKSRFYSFVCLFVPSLVHSESTFVNQYFFFGWFLLFGLRVFIFVVFHLLISLFLCILFEYFFICS